MTTFAQLNQTYQTAKQWDRKIGHYMGADFLKDVDGVGYALSLAMRAT